MTERARLRAAVRRLDRWLRRRQGIYEFCDDERCLFRIALVRAREERALSDGTRVAPGEAVIGLHLWNEHVPPLPRRGADLAWAARAGRLIGHSLRLLAVHVAAAPALRDVQALHGRMALPAGRDDAGEPFALARRFGFDASAPRPEGGVRGRARELGRELLLWALIWGFNPGGLRNKGLRWCWCELWMSRARLLSRYAAAGHPSRERP